MTKILHTADIHIREYKDERWGALEELVNKAQENKVDFLVISGDVFDKDVQAEKLRSKMREVFSEVNFETIILPGNHDSKAFKSGMYLGENVTALTDLEKPIKRGDIVFWGIPFSGEEDEGMLNKLFLVRNKMDTSKTNILLYHGELLDAFFSNKDFGGEEENRFLPTRLSYFKEAGVDYVLAGHFHSNFDVREIEKGKYFVYPGSPVSITKRETGVRKAHLLEVGKVPQEVLLSAPYFQKITIKFDPIEDKDPVGKVKEEFENLSPQAKVILSVGGFVDVSKIGMEEEELVKEIEKIGGDKVVEKHIEFKDIHYILEDSLFSRFMEILEEKREDPEKQEEIRDLAIRAFTESDS